MNDVRLAVTANRKIYLSGYKNFSVKRSGILTCPWPKLGAGFEVDNDLTPLFPYINASVAGAKYYDKPERIQFLFEGVQCTLYPHEIIAAAFIDYDHAVDFSGRLLGFLNDLYEKREAIKPDYRKIKPLPALDIYKLLPKTNCGECGLPSCLAFAGALSTGRANTGQCPGFSEPIAARAVYPVLDKDGRLASTIEIDLPEPSDPTTSPQHESAARLEHSRLTALLTGRELEVLTLMAAGATNPEISEKLQISPHTVKTHVVHIYEKLGVNDRTQAAVLASKHNLI